MTILICFEGLHSLSLKPNLPVRSLLKVQICQKSAKYLLLLESATTVVLAKNQEDYFSMFCLTSQLRQRGISVK